MNYVIYDFETSGKEKLYLHPTQFAAALVDENFKILETFNERCRLRDGVVVDPGSLMITRTTIDSLKNEQSYYEFIKKIHAKFQAWSPAIFFGYNNISFDDEVLRQHFYQTLLDPYINTSKLNTRIDLQRIVIALNALELDIINFEKNEKNNRSILKLESICRANNIDHEHAHDALSDVKVTIELAKIIQKKAPVFWENSLKTRSPKMLSELLQTDSFFYLAPQHPSSVKYIPVSFITANPNDQKELVFFNLKTNDYEKELEKRSREIARIIEKHNYIKTKPPIEKRTFLIEKSNRFPIMFNHDFFKNTKHKESQNNELYGEMSKKIQSSENFIENMKQSLVDLWEEREVNKQSENDKTLEEQIYGNRLSRDDQDKIDEFNNSTDPFEKLKISKHIVDKRYKQHIDRIFYEEYSSELTNKERQKYQKSLAEKVFNDEKDDKGKWMSKWMTIPKAKEIIESLKNDEKYQKETDYINEIENHISSEEKKYKKYLGD